MGNPFDPMNILLVVFAVVAFVRLRSSLGKRTGNEEPLAGRQSTPYKKNGKEGVPDSIQETKMSLEDVLNQLSKFDNSFTQETFINGAKSVYEMIIMAYAGGDLKDVKQFLSKDVYSGFSSAVKTRVKSGQKLFNEIVGFDSVEIKSASITEETVELIVSFETKIISYAIDSKEQTIEGNQDSPQSITDIWVFERSIKSRDPNWLLISTNLDD